VKTFSYFPSKQMNDQTIAAAARKPPPRQPENLLENSLSRKGAASEAAEKIHCLEGARLQPRHKLNLPSAALAAEGMFQAQEHLFNTF